MFKRALIEGLKNITRSFWLSATAISVVTVSLGSVVLIASMSTTVSYMAQSLDKLVTIRALIKETFPEERIPDLISGIKTIEGVEVEQVKYFNREEAKSDLLNNSMEGFNKEFLEKFEQDENLAFRFVQISPQNPDLYAPVITSLNNLKIEGVDVIWELIPTNTSFVDAIKSLNHWVRLIGLILILIFTLVSILVMINILRITIYSHKDEIEIMRLVGATNNYIRLPFVAEGIFYNVISAIFVVLIFVPVLNAILPTIEIWIDTGGSVVKDYALSIQIYTTIGVAIFSGIAVGIITTYIAIQRYLQL
jgi:cell division transport system permease protein